MAKIFNLPAVGDTMVEGEIVTWFVAVGDVVDLDQPICSLETDKSVVEMTTPHRGTVLYLAADVGGVVQVGAPLIVVGEPGEDLPADLLDAPTAPAAVSSPAAPSAPAAPTTSAPSTSSPAKNGWSQGPPPSNAPSLIPTSSPLLRRFAQEEGVNLATVRGTGPGGRITRADVTAAAGGAPAQPSISRGPVLALPKVRKIARDGGIDLRDVRGSGPHGSITMTDLAAVAPELAQPVRGERVRMSTMRRAIARNLTGAAEVPQFTSMMDFDATSLLARRAALRDTLNGPVPLDALLMHDLTVVLSEHRLMNAQLGGRQCGVLRRVRHRRGGRHRTWPHGAGGPRRRHPRFRGAVTRNCAPLHGRPEPHDHAGGNSPVERAR